MRIPSTLVITALTATWLLSTSLDPSNPPTGKTGAPGETTCAQSSCHSGGTFTGTVNISGIPDTVVANQSYTLTLTNTSNASKAGFQLTCLTSANAKCGALTAGSGVNVATGSSRQYARQSTPKTLSGGSTSWTFTWKAPATLAVDSFKFYFVTLCANGNGNRTGDNVLLNSKSVHFKTLTSAASDPVADRMVSLYPNPARDFVRVTLTEAASGEVTLFDANGRQVLHSALDAETQLNVSSLPVGIYTAQIHFGERTALKRLVIER